MQPDLARLEASLPEVLSASAPDGRVHRIYRRPDTGLRERLDRAEISLADGLVGDNWRLRSSSRTPDGSANPNAQITLMNVRILRLLAEDESRWELAGDQLIVDFDLSAAASPAGTRLRIGTAVLEITAEPHTGCGKFAERFGRAAREFVNTPAGRALNLRGVNARVVEAGSLAEGDRIERIT